mmetsp:Transcript_34336/g.53607  ORF Transcript_34336/g.53607 Transcript_34336/m.53607 type:complete len:428 (-) Transcript_34336:115-1398(-)|eukprot:CAMPEP_0201523642 /NCGR_PEP_ID=MMETSP0161_2-20130828/20670_1 /ASSEMBLY_ACC=CAM_ASM_000251 /TAXON_ID=180227 /ORGANISM="Neoparamoeba aestuarina, Strain SoJaBio B1-5/56/2" /LENGTH=427 /DNA_ID=CAMNT_0047922827 /DNA_START=263 /DNA_END=1546 /DNA_ORIENTATION=+
MGRNKISIQRISNERSRQSTFMKRKNGLMKKAMELSILCDCEIALTLISGNKRVFQYCTSSPERFRKMFDELRPVNLRTLTNEDYGKLYGDDRTAAQEEPTVHKAHLEEQAAILPHFPRADDVKKVSSASPQPMMEDSSLTPPRRSHPNSMSGLSTLSSSSLSNQVSTFSPPMSQGGELSRKRKALNVWIPVPTDVRTPDASQQLPPPQLRYTRNVSMPQQLKTVMETSNSSLSGRGNGQPPPFKKSDSFGGGFSFGPGQSTSSGLSSLNSPQPQTSIFQEPSPVQQNKLPPMASMISPPKANQPKQSPFSSPFSSGEESPFRPFQTMNRTPSSTDSPTMLPPLPSPSILFSSMSGTPQTPLDPSRPGWWTPSTLQTPGTGTPNWNDFTFTANPHHQENQPKEHDHGRDPPAPAASRFPPRNNSSIH